MKGLREREFRQGFSLRSMYTRERNSEATFSAESYQSLHC